MISRSSPITIGLSLTLFGIVMAIALKFVTAVYGLPSKEYVNDKIKAEVRVIDATLRPMQTDINYIKMKIDKIIDK